MGYKIVASDKTKQPAQEFNLGESLSRFPAQAGGGIAAQTAGIFGDVAKTVNNLIADPITKHVFRQEPVPYEETTIGKILPTTEQHQKVLEENFNILKPKNKLEEFNRDIAKDTAALFLPGKLFKMGRYGFSPMRSLGISLAANTAGKGTELFSGDKKKGDIVKSSTMLGLSFLNPTGAKNIAQNLYQNAASKLPQNASTSALNLNNSLNSLSNKILQGRPGSNVAPSEKFVLDEIDKFKSLINNNRINMSSLVAQKRSFNEELQNNLFKLTDKASRTRAKTLAKQISHDVRDTMQEYGKANPEWWKYQSSADEAFGAIEQSNYISRILQKYLHGKSSALTHLFGVGIPSASAHLTGPFATSIGVTAYIASKLGHRVLRSKALKTHYAKVIAAAATDNPKIIHKKIDELEQAIKEDEKKKPGKYKKVG